MQAIPNEVYSEDQKEVKQFVQKKTRYAHRNCITWRSKGLFHAAVVTPDSIKRMVLDLGTQGIHRNAILHDAQGECF